MPDEESRAEWFWSIYSDRNFVSLKRQGHGNYEGVALDFGDGGEAFLGEQIPFAMTRQELLDHSYKTDDRFAPCVFTNLANALSTVLQDPELAEPTEPNRHRLRLVIRLIRDPSPDEPSYSVVVTTRNAARDYAGKKIGKDQFLGQLKDLREGPDKNYDALCQTILKYLDAGTLSAEQAAHLLYATTPAADTDYLLVSRIVLETLSECDLPTEKACRFLEALRPTQTDYAEMIDTGRIASVHTERDVLLKALSMCHTDERITAQFLAVLNNHANEDLFVVFEAIAALGLHNDKSSIRALIACLAREEMARYRDAVEEALQMLCSGPTLISKAIFGADLSQYMDDVPEGSDEDEGEDVDQDLKMEYDYWEEKAKTLPNTAFDWSRSDAESVFWQKRLRCALSQGPPQFPAQQLQALRNDEVATVRIAAVGSGAR